MRSNRKVVPIRIRLHRTQTRNITYMNRETRKINKWKVCGCWCAASRERSGNLAGVVSGERTRSSAVIPVSNVQFESLKFRRKHKVQYFYLAFRYRSPKFGFEGEEFWTGVRADASAWSSVIRTRLFS